MEVCLINDIKTFEALRPTWERIHASDPLASVFVTWAWLRGWLDVSPYPWSILGVKSDGGGPADWVGFLPVSIRGSMHALRMDQVREIHMAGDPGADYAGMVCDPQHQNAVIEALAKHLATKQQWDRIRFKEVNDPRIETLVRALEPHGISVSIYDGTCCPYIPLPATWDEYLQNVMSYETRKSLRKKLKLAEKELRITHMDDASRDLHIDALVHLGGLRKRDTPNDNLPRCKRIFHAAAEGGIASIVLIWHDQTPIAGMGAFIDRHANSYGTYLTGFDEGFAEYSAGRVVNAVCIQHAIEKGFTTLDFLRGPEPYKFQFGAQKRFTKHCNATRKGLQTTARMALSGMRQKLGI